MQFKYQEQPEVIECSSEHSDLLHEALYSFEADIDAAYNLGRLPPGAPISVQSAYAKYTYTGARGEANYGEIASAHSRTIYRVLLDETDLYTESKGEVSLDYTHPLVKCLVDKIQNSEVKSTMQNLIEANSMSSEIMASPFRINSRDARDDKHFALYLALDTYYKNLEKQPKTSTQETEAHTDHDHDHDH
ncbi:MAG: hypothetical protein HKM28_02630 [Flavobacteriaceae bacterium]|nr:hypothetical protein [Flavobacteriaceae bacterium]